MIALVSTLNFIGANAQGLSLSFNLTETDTLANIIAASRKYEISSLTLSGYINRENVDYIKNLNANGTLVNLDLSDASHVCTSYILREYKTYNTERWGDRTGYIFETVLEYLREKGWDNFNWDGWLHYGNKPYFTHVIDTYEDDCIIRKMSIEFYASHSGGGGNKSVRFEKEIKIMYTIETPRLCFQDCSFSTLKVPDNIKFIGGSDCRFRVKSCNEFVLGNKINTIGENAFKDSYIRTIKYNSTIDSIKASAFENATGNIFANPDFVKGAKYIGEAAFKNSRLLTDEGENNSITLQATAIGSHAFENAAIPKLVLPNVEAIGDSAFMASSVREIELGNKTNTIGKSMFEGCKELRFFKGGQSIKRIGAKAFSGCAQLKDFVPSNTLESIGDYAFANDAALTSFSVPNATVSIGQGAFANSGLRNLQLGRFGDFRRDIVTNCDSLETISVASSNEKLSSMDGVLFSKNKTKLIFYPYAKRETIYELPNGVTEIADSAFYAANCLGALVVPETIKTIGKDALSNSAILEIKISATIPPKVTNNTLGVDQSLVRLFVPKSAYSTYYIANYWGDFKYIYTIEDAESNTNVPSYTNSKISSRYYGIKGVLIETPIKGINIVKMSDGTVKKVLVK